MKKTKEQPKRRQASFNVIVAGECWHNDIWGPAKNFKKQYDKRVADVIAEAKKKHPGKKIKVEHGFNGGDFELALKLAAKMLKKKGK